jgi:hypothetical protein
VSISEQTLQPWHLGLFEQDLDFPRMLLPYILWWYSYCRVWISTDENQALAHTKMRATHTALWIRWHDVAGTPPLKPFLSGGPARGPPCQWASHRSSSALGAAAAATHLLFLLVQDARHRARNPRDRLLFLDDGYALFMEPATVAVNGSVLFMYVLLLLMGRYCLLSCLVLFTRDPVLFTRLRG